MALEPDMVTALLEKVQAGDGESLAALFTGYRDHLRRMVRLRLDRRLAGRLDPSDVLQEVYLDAARRVPEYFAGPQMPFALWLRLLTGRRLLELHRQHLGARMRSAERERSLGGETCALLANELAGQFTSPSQAAVRAEMESRLLAALGEMAPIDREVLVLRHFEELSNNEVADALGIPKAAASNRYIRALKRLRADLTDLLG
jgi:RNA polymerase sigma-70 factor (ECF subfamily)